MDSEVEMTIELFAALLMVLLAPATAIVSATAITLSNGGFSWGLGNRHTDLEIPFWMARLKRSHQNIMENLPSFTGVVLIAHVMSVNDSVTSIAAVVFVISRIIFVFIYTAGITLFALRTISYFVSVAAIAAIAWRILI